LYPSTSSSSWGVRRYLIDLKRVDFPLNPVPESDVRRGLNKKEDQKEESWEEVSMILQELQKC